MARQQQYDRINLTSATQFSPWLTQLETELSLKDVGHTLDRNIRPKNSNVLTGQKTAKFETKFKGKRYKHTDHDRKKFEIGFPGTAPENQKAIGLIRRCLSTNLSALIPRNCKFAIEAIGILKKSLKGKAEADAQHLLKEYNEFRISDNENLENGIARFNNLYTKAVSCADKYETLLPNSIRLNFKHLTKFSNVKAKLIDALPERGFAEVGTTWLENNNIKDIHELYGRIESQRLKIIRLQKRPNRNHEPNAIANAATANSAAVPANDINTKRNYPYTKQTYPKSKNPRFEGPRTATRSDSNASSFIPRYSIEERAAFKAKSTCYECGQVGHFGKECRRRKLMSSAYASLARDLYSQPSNLPPIRPLLPLPSIETAPRLNDQQIYQLYPTISMQQSESNPYYNNNYNYNYNNDYNNNNNYNNDGENDIRTNYYNNPNINHNHRDYNHTENNNYTQNTKDQPHPTVRFVDNSNFGLVGTPLRR